MKNKDTLLGPMLNLYPDSIGGQLSALVELLKDEPMKDAFQSIYILPSLYHTDLDRGFSVQDYEINGTIAKEENLVTLQEMGIDLKLDFILNHLSVLSPQFQDLLKNGEKSKYKDFFIHWNSFWDGYGEMSEEGYILPEKKYIQDMFFRKEGLPILMVQFPDGSKQPYWNTFYQEIKEEEDGSVSYLGQMDLNIQDESVWQHYQDTLKKLASYGAKIVRLDAFAYAPKAVGRKNFLNEPETWDLLEKIQKIADPYALRLLPEIHATYEEGIYQTLADKGYWVYDFFLPGLIRYTFVKKDATKLVRWINEVVDKGIQTVNMLGCHDGIPVLDLKGLLSEEEIEDLIATLKKRGGYVKDLHGEKKMYYQVNMTYFSALNRDEKQLLLARALQLFMPGKPQIWYLDLFAGENDVEAVKKAGAGGHKEINRTNLDIEVVKEKIKEDVVVKQLELLHFRKHFPAFKEGATITCHTKGSNIEIKWKNELACATLKANLEDYDYSIEQEEYGL